MSINLFQYVLRVNPFTTEDMVAEIRELNEWDLLIIFKDGRKVLYDRFNNYHKNIYYDNINEITDEQEKRQFAYKLRSLMGRKHISQEELAKRIGTSQVMVSHYMNGRSLPNIVTGRKIAKVLDCSLDEFFYQDY